MLTLQWTLQELQCPRYMRLKPFDKLANLLVKHLDGILKYCRTPVPFGVVQAVNANLKSLIRRGRGYRNLRYLLLKAQRQVVSSADQGQLRKAA